MPIVSSFAQKILRELLDYDNDDNLYCNDISGDDSDYDDILQGIGWRTAGFLVRISQILGPMLIMMMMKRWWLKDDDVDDSDDDDILQGLQDSL